MTTFLHSVIQALIHAPLTVRLLLLAVTAWYMIPVTFTKQKAVEWIDDFPVRFTTIVNSTSKLLAVFAAVLLPIIAAAYLLPSALAPLANTGSTELPWFYYVAGLLLANSVILLSARKLLPDVFEQSHALAMSFRAGVLSVATLCLFLLPLVEATR